MHDESVDKTYVEMWFRSGLFTDDSAEYRNIRNVNDFIPKILHFMRTHHPNDNTIFKP